MHSHCLWRALAGCGFLAVIYFGGLYIGELRARVGALESWKVEARLVLDSRDARIRKMESELEEMKMIVDALKPQVKP